MSTPIREELSMSNKRRCPICGSYHTIDSDTNHFKCLSCLAFFPKKVPVRSATSDLLVAYSEGTHLLGEDIYKNCIKSIISLECCFQEFEQYGTGFMTMHGHIVTVAHLLFDENGNLPRNIVGTLSDNLEVYPLECIACDKDSDIAFLKIRGVTILPLKHTTYEPIAGESIFVIGNSKGEGLCILEGIISACNRVINSQEYLMITAPVINGDSGAPVINKNGEIIGMVVSGRKDTKAMNYALPIKTLINSAKELGINEKQ